MEAANRREGWKEERPADGKERRNGGAAAAAAARRETGFVVVTVADPSLLLPSCYSVSSPPPTLLMGDSRVPPFGANYRLFGVGVLLGLEAAPSLAPTAPNLPIKHSHPQSDHLGKLRGSLITPRPLVIAGGS